MKTSTGMSTFSDHILNAGHQMRPMEETFDDPILQERPKENQCSRRVENYESDHFQPHAQHSPQHQPSLPDTTFSSGPDNGLCRQ